MNAGAGKLVLIRLARTFSTGIRSLLESIYIKVPSLEVEHRTNRKLRSATSLSFSTPEGKYPRLARVGGFLYPARTPFLRGLHP